MIFVCYPKCSTCRKAQAWLDERKVPYEIRLIKEDNPGAEELKVWKERSGLPLKRFFNTSGLPLKRFFNTSGLQYKTLNLKDKLPGMSEEEQLALLASDGMLVKRPLLVAEDFVLVGFREAEYGERFGK